MKHRIVLDLHISSNLSDQAREGEAATVFGMINDFAAVVKTSSNVGLDTTMFSTPDTTPLVSMKDACIHSFEIVAPNAGCDTFVKCVKCASRYKFDDIVPEGNHEHELNIDVEGEEITCSRCDDTFGLDADSISSICQHVFTVDLEKKLVCCSVCEGIYDVEDIGNIELIGEQKDDVATTGSPVPCKNADTPPYEDSFME